MRSLLILLIFGLLLACNQSTDDQEIAEVPAVVDRGPDSLDKRCAEAGLVNIGDRLPEIIINLKYSTNDNFLHTDVYGDFTTAWLQPDVADMLEKAWKVLQERDSSLTFVIYDATRPHSVQERMWAVLDLPPVEKGKYLSNPKNGSIHNYGAAVDISIARKADSVALDMGTPFDFFGPEAEPEQEQHFLQLGILKPEQIQNRQLLRKVMESAGFRQLPTEWWHYNACSREEAKVRYKRID